MTDLNLEEIRADLDEVRHNVDHAEAQHNTHALTALRAAEKLYAEVERLRVELDAIGDLAYRFSAFDAGYMVREFTAEIQSRAKRAAGGA